MSYDKCPNCGKPIYFSYSENETRWPICKECFEAIPVTRIEIIPSLQQPDKTLTRLFYRGKEVLRTTSHGIERIQHIEKQVIPMEAHLNG